MKKKKIVVLGFVGSQLDNGRGSGRWEKWRPSVALTQHPELVIDRFELLYHEMHRPVVKLVSEDIASVSPETEVVSHALAIGDAWGFRGGVRHPVRFRQGLPLRSRS